MKTIMGYMRALYLDLLSKNMREKAGGINHEGFTKRNQQSSVGSMPTSKRENVFQLMGGGQNANKLCKKPFVKPA